MYIEASAVVLLIKHYTSILNGGKLLPHFIYNKQKIFIWIFLIDFVPHATNFCFVSFATEYVNLLSASFPHVHTSDQVTNKGSFTCFMNSGTRCRPTLQKCGLIKDIPSLPYERKSLMHFYHSSFSFANPSMSVLENERNDPGVAPFN